jgi:hypothetical protein
MGAQGAGQTGDVTRRDVSWEVPRCTRVRERATRVRITRASHAGRHACALRAGSHSTSLDIAACQQ